MIIDYVKEFVKHECNQKENVFGSAFFEQHVMIVKDYACRLADILGADREIVEISSYLHDISAVMNINTLSHHSELSSVTADAILKSKLYDTNKIEAIKKVIKSHSVPIKLGEGTLEEVCVSNADAISQIVNPSYWLFFAFSVKKMGYEQGIEWYSQKVKANKDALIEQAKNLIDKKTNEMY